MMQETPNRESSPTGAPGAPVDASERLVPRSNPLAEEAMLGSEATKNDEEYPPERTEKRDPRRAADDTVGTDERGDDIL